jgi:outer membrane protein TolC
MKFILLFVVFVFVFCAFGMAQDIPQEFLPTDLQNPFLGTSVSEKPVDSEIGLSLSDAIDRGLKYNLRLYLSGQESQVAQGVRWKALADLLPNLSGGVTESVQQINIAAFGFPPSPVIPSIIGPFTVFDVRASLDQAVLDLHSIYKYRSEDNNVKAQQFRSKDARDLVVLITANLYLKAAASISRVEAAQSQLTTAEAFYNQAKDMKQAGMVAGIDVLRAQVEMESRRQQLIGARNETEKDKLALARAIGLPTSQKFQLTDEIRNTPFPPITLDQALEKAFSTRADYLATETQVRANEFAYKAAKSKYYPSLGLHADYGDLGSRPNSSHGTFSVVAGLHIPIFDGGETHGEAIEENAKLLQIKAKLEDLHAQIEQQVRTAFLDLTASTEQVEVAERALELAKQQVEQAQDRFAAGMVSNLEVVQAQDALAIANENYISGLFAENMAKALLARATGGAEATAKAVLGGKP